MSIEVVRKTDITGIKGRPKHSETYEAWFSQVLSLKEGEALKITLSRKSAKSLPSPAAARFAVDRWNREHPDKRIGKVWRNTRTDAPILYLFREEKEEGSQRQKPKKA
jgi:hypothetical protein